VFGPQSIAVYMTVPPATSVAFTPPPSPASPQIPGASVLWTAAASGGTGSYEYKFWVKNPAGAWSVGKDYGIPGNTWTWDTTGLATGTYSVQVWARSAGSTATYEAYTSLMSYVIQ